MEDLLKDITFQELEVFAGATQLKSLRALARRAHLKPAHVSKLIRRLETKIGNPLLKRSVSGVVLTDEGTRVLGAVEAILEGARKLRTGAAVHPDEKRVVNVGANGFLSRSLVCRALARLSDEDIVRYRLVELTHNNVVPLGLEGAFEMAVHVGPLEWTRVWVSKEAGQMRWVLVGRAGHPLGSDAVDANVQRYPFVIPTDWRFGRHRDGNDFCPLPVERRTKGWEATTPESALEVARHSNQLTFLPEPVARDAIACGQVAPIRVEGWPVVERSVYVSVRSDLVSRRQLTLVVGALGDSLKMPE